MLVTEDLIAAMQASAPAVVDRATAGISIELAEFGAVTKNGEMVPIVFDKAKTKVRFASHPELWLQDTVYIVPASGLYHLSLTFTKEAFGGGTPNDVFVRAYAQAIGTKTQREIGTAWAGQNAGPSRDGAAFTTVVPLQSLDAVVLKLYRDVNENNAEELKLPAIAKRIVLTLYRVG